MPYTDADVSLYYEVAGDGERPVVLVHGWPLSSRMWEYQVPVLVNVGFRCITYDRRGFGDSNRPWDGYDYDTLTDDLAHLLDELDLRDVALVGFSMGGGEVARLVARGNDRVTQAVLMSAVTPSLRRSEESPNGVPDDVLEGFQEAMERDRIGFLKDFGNTFFGLSTGLKLAELVTGGGERDVPSSALMDYFLQIESFASPRATRECARAFGLTDFSDDLRRIAVPTLVLHGDDDKTVPFEATGRRAAELIPDCRLEVVPGGPHGIWYTHRRQVNELLLQFLQR